MQDDLQARVESLVGRVEHLYSSAVKVPTLMYFDIVGIAWPLRCLLHLQDIAYDYIPVTLREWVYREPNGRQPIKAALRNGHLPLYADSELRLNESTLVLKTLARRAGLLGRDEDEALAVESVLAHCYDALFHWNGLFPVNMRLNIPDDVAEARLNSFMGDGVWGLVADGYRNHLRVFRNVLRANTADSGFLVGAQLTAADLSAFNVLCNWYKAFDRQVFSEEYPDLDAYIQRIAEVPGIGAYIREVQEPTLWFELPTVALRLTSPGELQGLVTLPPKGH